MKYWVYINDKVVGPYAEDKLAELEGFTPETLICTETGDPGATQEWVKASTIFDFPEPATITQGQLTPQDANSQFFPSQTQQDDSSLTSMLLAKIDKLMNEIEGMKGKLDDAIAASNAAQEAASKQINALAEHHNTPTSALIDQQPLEQADTNLSAEQNTATDNEKLENTVNLVKHAEQIVMQAQQTEQNKPNEFLDEIQIGEKDTSLEKGVGEEVVLRSALDSLYNVTEPVEEEKESTFQDLLSPITANLQQEESSSDAPATADEVFAEKPATQEEPLPEITDEQREQIIDEITTPAQQEDAISQAIDEAEKATPAEEPKEEQPAEEIPNEQENPSNQEIAPVEETPAEEPTPETPAEEQSPVEQSIPLEEPVQPEATPVEAVETPEETPVETVETQEETPAADIPEIPTVPQEEQNVADFIPSHKDGLDLSDHPQLSIQDIPNDDVPQEVPSIDEAAVKSANLDQIELTPMDPVTDEQQEHEQTESILELVPGKELEQPQSDGLISQEDLEDAFAEQNQAPENAFMEREQAPENTPIEPKASDNEVQPSEVLSVQQPLPANEEPFNPKEMTEVQLKEGSTYLISDFIPPAETGNKKESAEIPAAYSGQANNEVPVIPQEEPAQKQEEIDATMIEIVPQKHGSQDSASKKEENPQPKADVNPAPQQEEHAEPQQHDAQAFQPGTEDLTLSQIKLENTIQPKRGGSRDIKTVPMVKEPAASDRLDLSDADLDLSAQHDLKSADFTPAGGGLVKGLLSLLASMILLVIIYFMLSYLNLIPAKYNLIKKSDSAAQEVQSADLMDQEIPVTQRPTAVQNAQSGDWPETDTQSMTSNPVTIVLQEVKDYALPNGQTLEQLINSRHPTAKGAIEWNVTTAVEPDNYSVLVKVPPENAQSFKISYRFNYNMDLKTLDPTISDSKNLLDSAR